MTTVSDTEIFQAANDALGKLDIDFSGYSGGGIHVVGGRESIDKIMEATHLAGMVPQLQDSISHLNKELKLLLAEKVRLINELTAMDHAAKSRMDLEAIVRRYDIIHVLLGLECLCHEEATIRKANHESRNVTDHWTRIGNILGRIARENVSREMRLS